MKLSKKLVSLCFFTTVFMSACGANNFTDYNVLNSLRVLTIIVDHPEANPGTTLNLTPILSDAKGAGRTLSYSIEACIDPGIGVGVQATCLKPDPSSFQSGTLTIPTGSTQTYTGAVASFSITLPDAATIFANRSSADQYNGVAYLVFYTLSAADGTTVTSFVRLMVSDSTKTQKNQNPVITSIDMNDVPINGVVSTPSQPTNFRVSSPGSSAENYQTESPTGGFNTKTETLVNTWFITDGSTDYQRTYGNAENKWTPPSSPAGHGIKILVVTRDGRDGATFQSIELN
jgi:hypothetical protein